LRSRVKKKRLNVGRVEEDSSQGEKTRLGGGMRKMPKRKKGILLLGLLGARCEWGGVVKCGVGGKTGGEGVGLA